MHFFSWNIYFLWGDVLLQRGYWGTLITSPKEPTSTTLNLHLWNPIEAKLIILKFQTFYFLRMSERWGQILVLWPISAVYVIATYENTFQTKLDPRIMHKTHMDHIIPHLHTLIRFLHKNVSA